jgi:hypothetical protein
MQHISLNLTEDPICNVYSELGEIFDEKLLAVASVCHGYTVGWDFSHRTRTHKHWSSPVWFVVVEWTKEGCLSSESDTRYVHDVPNECIAPNLSISRCDQLCWSNTIPVTCTGTYRTIICVVSDKTRSITFTHGILIIKITIIIILLQYFTNNKRGGYHETAAAHTH